MDTHTTVKTRIAPSPTGYFHVGTARTALFNYLFTKQRKGTSVVRIEDTDKERSDDTHTKLILDGLAWLGLTYDEDPIIQSQNAPRHKEILHQLVADGFAYEAEDRTEGEGKVIRFKNPNEKVTFTDMVRGDITFDTTDLKDFVIAKGYDEPLYHLAVVVDDFDEGITHVIRGDDHISNTPRQILIARAIGAPELTYAHLPLLLDTDRSKLSKRKGAKSLDDLKQEGFLPEAVNNYLALLGWNPGIEKEVYTMEELIADFDISKIQKAGAIFSMEKLKWINKEHIKKMSTDERIALFASHFPDIHGQIVESGMPVESIVDILLERNSTFAEIKTSIDTGEIDFVLKDPTPTAEMLLWKNNPDKKLTQSYLQEVVALFESMTTDTLDMNNVKDTIWPLAEKIGKGEVLWPLRVALSGREKSPDPFVLSVILGKERVVTRIHNAIKILD